MVRNTRIDHECGTVGGTAYFWIAVVFFGVLLLIFNPLAASMTDALNDQLDNPSIVNSQEKFDAFATVLLFFVAFPVIIVLGFGYYLIKVALMERDGWV